ncbi:MAG: hypothetical protein JO307_16720 [Bryobacterales bacterium]|nr:hypothetical protein [Bryobacterales bacterium]MBV9400257.1 hypothetical protein [Bryobacterales bacterium]
MSGQITKVGFLFSAAVLCAQAQWLNYPTPGTPRTRGGKPDLFAKAPRAANGKPDLSGVWQTELAHAGENERLFGASITDAVVLGDDPRTFSKYALNILADFKPEESPLRPEGAELFRKNLRKRATESPTVRCLPQGLPRGELFNYAPFKILQTPGIIAVLYELDNTFRQIYTDGRKLPADPQPSWLGYSIGHWEGDTLVVDAAGFNDQTWLDLTGHGHSEALHLQERFHRRDFGHMDLSVTIDDPKLYTRSFTVKVTEVLIPDSDVLETVCNEDEKDLGHLAGR